MGTLMSFENVVLAFWTEWWIPVAVLASMTIQLILLLTGTARKHSSILRIVAWNAYNWSDYVATLALGGMVQNAIGNGNKIYAIWAPILLLHLGAPDNISAYALEDNEFWLRHGLLMIVQVLAAIFVVINCARGWHFILLSMFLMLAGPIKYAEKTLALRNASNAAIVESVFPILTYMRLEPLLNVPIKRCRNIGSTLNDTFEHYYYIIRGESQMHRILQSQSEFEDRSNNTDAYLRAIQLTPNFLTLEDILADPFLSSSPHIRHTCIAFALFKLYRRRFSGINMYEWQERKTRWFFTNFSGIRPIFGSCTDSPEMDVLTVLSLELQFIFDSLYTKSFHTAFTRLGILFRIFTAFLLVASVGLLKFMNKELQKQDMVVNQARLITFLLVVMALFVEIFQLIRMLLSNWVTVWLACNYIQLLNKELHTYLSPGELLIIKTIRSFTAWCLLITTSMNLSAAHILHDHWPGLNCIGQYALIDHLTCEVVLRKTVQESEITSNNQQSCVFQNGLQYIKSCISEFLFIKPHMNHVQFLMDPDLVHQFRISVVRDVLCLCGKLSDLISEKNFRYFEEFIRIWKVLERRAWRKSFQQYCVYIACNRERTRSSERVILSWHIATTVCELMEEINYNITDSEEMINTVKTNAKILSRYLLSLLVHKAELLPCHAEIGKLRTLDVERAFLHTLRNVHKYIMARRSHHLPCTTSSDINLIDLKLLVKTLVMESPDLKISDDDLNSSNVVADADVHQVLLEIYKLQCQYYDQNGATNSSCNETLQVPQILWPGLMVGKLLMLGITSREERWQFIWSFWIEVLASMASLNNSGKHLKHLTMGSEFLTHIWVLLGHMGFGKRI